MKSELDERQKIFDIEVQDLKFDLIQRVVILEEDNKELSAELEAKDIEIQRLQTEVQRLSPVRTRLGFNSPGLSLIEKAPEPDHDDGGSSRFGIDPVASTTASGSASGMLSAPES